MQHVKAALVLALVGLAAPAVHAGEARADTALQHHAWSRKFVPAGTGDPRLASPAIIGARAEVLEGESRCGATGVIFSGRPLAQWPADLCG